MQTILGAGGAIGAELAKTLPEYTSKIRLVSRNPEKVNPDDELVSADLLKENEVHRAVKGSEVVYVTIGFPYRLKIWQKNWPKLISNVIEACKENNASLVFFDNIYMYDMNHLNGMDENTPVNPPSKKGQIRDQISRMIMDEVNNGKLTALIARAADFYGPSPNNTSVLTETVVNNLRKGKKAIWLGSDQFKHSFTFTPDAGKATAILGNTREAYNQVWHLPTAPDPFTGKEWVSEIARAMNVQARYMVVPKFMVRLLGLFSPLMKELVEMMYQYDRDYVFDSSKFEKHFNFSPTPYKEGIKTIVNA